MKMGQGNYSWLLVHLYQRFRWSFEELLPPLLFGCRVARQLTRIIESTDNDTQHGTSTDC